MEKVSIIVPVYNVELYLEQCIESLLSQTYSNIEIILVNDGSKDRSGQICDFYRNKDERILVIHKENEGLGYARNTGLKYVSGEYVTFVDSDDYVEKNLVELLISGIKKYNGEVCIGGFERVSDEGDSLFKEEYEEQVFLGKEVMNSLLARMLGSSPEKSDAIRMSVWNVLYSVKLIKKNNILFTSERKFISEDIIFDTDFYPHVMCAVVIPSSAYKYRVNQQSLTKKYNTQRLKKNNELYLELKRRIMSLEMGEMALYRLQRQTFVNWKACIRQEIPKYSNMSFSKARNNILVICNDKTILSVIEEYPVEKLGFKQKIFVKLIKHKCATALLFFGELGVL